MAHLQQRPNPDLNLRVGAVSQRVWQSHAWCKCACEFVPVLARLLCTCRFAKSLQGYRALYIAGGRDVWPAKQCDQLHPCDCNNMCTQNNAPQTATPGPRTAACVAISPLGYGPICKCTADCIGCRVP
eukprot:198022-Chlamydomonas_euryale.AAC.1